MMTYTQLSNTEPYLIIHADGRITASEKLKPSETADRVLECIKTQWMEDSQSKKIRELQERIKRLEEAGDDLYANCDLSRWDSTATTARKLSDQNAWLKAKEAKP